jgi:poly-gamma-glutamate synthesis protein (capsule biosynthesis protein)
MKRILIALIIFFYNQTALAFDVRLIFVGDIMTHIQQLEAAERSKGQYDFAPQFENIRNLLSGDLVVGNFETTLAGAERGFTGYPAFSTPDALLDDLKDIGFNVLLLANNHIYDKGVTGLKRTIEEIDSRGLYYTGAWSAPEEYGENVPLLIEIKGIKIGIFNYSYGSNFPIDESKRLTTHLNIISNPSINNDIKYLKDKGANFIIAAFHWGNEYQPQPSKQQRELANICFDEGTDIVVGTHPHILQPIEVFSSKEKVRMAAYSLGNFVSFQRTQPRERSVILAVNISGTDTGIVTIKDISIVPIYVQVTGSGKSRTVQIIPAPERIESLILDFLKVTKQKDNFGFYTLYKLKTN